MQSLLVTLTWRTLRGVLKYVAILLVVLFLVLAMVQTCRRPEEKTRLPLRDPRTS